MQYTDFMNQKLIKLILFTFILGLFNETRASDNFPQENTCYSSYISSEFHIKQNFKDKKSQFNAQRAKRLKITGLVFCSLAGVGYLTSSILFIKGITPKPNKFSFPNYFKIGAAGYLSSSGLLIIGLPPFLIGKRELSKSKKKPIMESKYIY